VDVLVAEQMNQYQVVVGIFSPFGACEQVVYLHLLVVEERFSALWTATVLPLGQFLLRKRQVSLQWHF
jgi:hypothetical protein